MSVTSQVGRALILLLLAIAGSTAASVTTKTFTGQNLPQQWSFGEGLIFTESDSLYLNTRLLVRGVDYTIDHQNNLFGFDSLSLGANDTLLITYVAAPSWMAQSYGRPIPQPSNINAPIHQPKHLSAGLSPTRFESTMNISGAKTFRFSTRSQADAEFGQSLDLSISGEPSPGLEIKGSISDRGYDPAYGFVNSRLNELDRINLAVKSLRFSGQLGDILVERPSRSGRAKAVSGLSLALNFPRWHLSADVARPRGRYTTFSWRGLDLFQGPYQIGGGGAARPIVPGSETIWLDGARLERGVDKDYEFDYAAGRVTFGARVPIDARSRIEIDYEPQATDYKKELYAVGGGLQLGDSAFFVSVENVREGDDRDQPLAGELSTADLALLELAGDSSAVRSGVTADTAGAYQLVVDSLPDSLFQYVGLGNGDYSLTFTFVGAALGEYRFLGGDQYEYVGPTKGDYLPLRKIASAERVDLYRAEIGMHFGPIGNLVLDLRQSRHDQNLSSSLDDNNNDAGFYRLTSDKRFMWHGQRNHFRFSRTVTDETFHNLERTHRADFDRLFLLPQAFVQKSRETVDRGELDLTPLASVRGTVALTRLAYKNKFLSHTGSLSLESDLGKAVHLRAAWREIDAQLDSLGVKGKGAAHNLSSDLTITPRTNWRVATGFESDFRTNSYQLDDRGTRYRQLRLSADNQHELLRYELFVEDSLIGSWQRQLNRSRLTAGSRRRFGDLGVDLTITQQWLDRQLDSESSILGNVNLRYRSPRRRLTVNSSYKFSQERTNARGITYLEVGPGRGQFRFEDGAYVPDPDGDYIEVEELLSDVARVRRAERSFFFSKDWRTVLVRFNSTIEEELKENGERKAAWLVPLWFDESQPFFFFSRRQSLDLHAAQLRGFYLFNVHIGDDVEVREIAGQRRKRRTIRGKLTLKQAVRQTYFSEEMELFRYTRDQYYSSGGEVDGYLAGLTVRQVLALGEISMGISFRRAETPDVQRSDILSLTLGGRLKFFERGEFRQSVELYDQQLTGVTGTPSLLLTDNKSGRRGAEWTTGFTFGARNGVRILLTLVGRHAVDRSARITGRGEVVAAF